MWKPFNASKVGNFSFVLVMCVVGLQESFRTLQKLPETDSFMSSHKPTLLISNALTFMLYCFSFPLCDDFKRSDINEMTLRNNAWWNWSQQSEAVECPVQTTCLIACYVCITHLSAFPRSDSELPMIIKRRSHLLKLKVAPHSTEVQ